MHPIASRILDFIYPARCQICEKALDHGSHLCEHCISHLRPIEAPFCAQCGECFDGQISSTFLCPNCHDLTFSFEFARAAIKSEGDGRHLIHEFKYLRQIHLARELAQLAQWALNDPRFTPYLEHGLFVPVPLFWKRKRNRRFNQSEEIARHLSRLTDIPFLNALKRIRNTETQTRFSRAKRLKNLKNAFSIHPKHQKTIAEKPIILIDDVFTTGSTAEECSKELIAHGAQKVCVLTVLRG
jgi:ComF family protein